MKHVPLALLAAAALCPIAALAAPIVYHTKTIDNFSCSNPQTSAILLDHHLGRQRIAEPDLQGLYHDGDCLGTDPSVPFELVSTEQVLVFDRQYRIAKIRFIPTSPEQQPFVNYVPFDEIERTAGAQ
jgi:hypothetical protein